MLFNNSYNNSGLQWEVSVILLVYKENTMNELKDLINKSNLQFSEISQSNDDDISILGCWVDSCTGCVTSCTQCVGCVGCTNSAPIGW